MGIPVFSNLFKASGRRNRKSYLLLSLVIGVISGIIGQLVGLAFASEMDIAMNIVTNGGDAVALTTITGKIIGFSILAALPFSIISILVGIQRAHDINRNGWLLLLFLVPLANIVLALILLFKRGTDGDNRFGPDPLAVEKEI